MEHLENVARNIRKRLIDVHAKGRASHIGTSFSALDIVVTLYHHVLKLNPQNSKDPKRDRFILSKGHGVSCVYAVLESKQLIPTDWLDNYYQNGSHLSGHPDRLAVQWLEASSGSLGHGLPMGVGMAQGLKMNNGSARVFVCLSDGELQEGSNWEAANLASRFQLDNLIVIVDANKWQSFDRTDKIMPIQSFKVKWEAFGCQVYEVDGHNFKELTDAFAQIPFMTKKPSVIIAHTIKGKGIKDFENELGYHYWPPKIEKVNQYIEELNA